MEKAYFTSAGEGERVGPNEHRVLGELSDLEVIELTFDAGFEVDPHAHDDHTDSFFVLEGEVEFFLDSEWRRGAPGTFVSVPPGIVHGFRNPGPGHIRVLNIHAPKAGFIDRIRNR